MSESDLVRRARQGDTAAWEELVRLHQQAVFRLAYLIVGDPHDADDVAQEAFIRAFYALDRFDPDGPLRPGCCVSAPIKPATAAARSAASWPRSGGWCTLRRTQWRMWRSGPASG